MPFDADLLAQLPLSQRDLLRRAIGCVLEDIVRLFYVDLAMFLDFNPDRTERDYFATNSGPTTLLFSGGIAHTLGVWGEALSIVVTPDPMIPPEYGRLISLASVQPPSPLKELTGQTCEDVRIWLFKDHQDEREAKQAGVSYLLSGGRELLYCIYLHGDLDNDVLLLDPFPLDRLAACVSIKDGRDLLPSLAEN